MLLWVEGRVEGPLVPAPATSGPLLPTVAAKQHGLFSRPSSTFTAGRSVVATEAFVAGAAIVLLAASKDWSSPERVVGVRLFEQEGNS
ncbi:hypothetical protein ACLKA7_000065 [Drosophila subpalustris]